MGRETPPRPANPLVIGAVVDRVCGRGQRHREGGGGEGRNELPHVVLGWGRWWTLGSDRPLSDQGNGPGPDDRVCGRGQHHREGDAGRRGKDAIIVVSSGSGWTGGTCADTSIGTVCGRFSESGRHLAVEAVDPALENDEDEHAPRGSVVRLRAHRGRLDDDRTHPRALPERPLAEAAEPEALDRQGQRDGGLVAPGTSHPSPSATCMRRFSRVSNPDSSRGEISPWCRPALGPHPERDPLPPAAASRGRPRAPRAAERRGPGAGKRPPGRRGEQHDHGRSAEH